MSNLKFPLADVGAYIDSREPAYPVDTLVSKTGKRVSITWATRPRTTYSIKQGILRSAARPQEYQRWLALFQRLFGGLDSCLLDDPEDNAASDPSVPGGGHCFGIGDGTATSFQLQRRTLGAIDDSLSGGVCRACSAARTNSLLWSADFTNAAWTKGTGALAAASGAIAPDNTAASVITYSGAGSAGAARVGQAVVAGFAGSYIVSVWLRADAPVSIALGNAVGAIITVALTTAWTRYDFNVTATLGGDVGLVIYSPASINTAFRIYAWGAQSELDLSISGTPTAYIPTTSAAVTVNPAFWPSFTDGFLPVNDLNGPTAIFRNDYQGNLQLLPWARTNLCLQSQTFANATWTKAALTPGSAITAPDGTTTAVPYTPTGNGTASQVISGLTAGQTYTVSVWLRYASGGDGKISIGTTEGSSPNTTLPVNTWVRLSFTFVAASTSTTFTIGIGSTWTTGEAIAPWGAQMEAGLTATSYVPTTTAAVSVTDYTLPGLGSVTLTAAPRAGAVLSWLGNYFIRVQLPDSSLSMDRVVQSLYSADGLQLISVLP